jgi:hypothetical protein
MLKSSDLTLKSLVEQDGLKLQNRVLGAVTGLFMLSPLPDSEKYAYYGMSLPEEHSLLSTYGF